MAFAPVMPPSGNPAKLNSFSTQQKPRYDSFGGPTTRPPVVSGGSSLSGAPTTRPPGGAYGGAPRPLGQGRPVGGKPQQGGMPAPMPMTGGAMAKPMQLDGNPAPMPMQGGGPKPQGQPMPKPMQTPGMMPPIPRNRMQPGAAGGSITPIAPVSYGS